MAEGANGSLLNAFKWAAHERESLQEYVEAEYESVCNCATNSGEPAALMILRHNFKINGDIVEWVKGTDLHAVRAATDFLVPLAPVHPFTFNLVCRRERKRRYVEASWTFLSLLEALHWMIFYDEFTQHPIICCDDCRKVFRGGFRTPPEILFARMRASCNSSHLAKGIQQTQAAHRREMTCLFFAIKAAKFTRWTLCSTGNAFVNPQGLGARHSH